ncbi:MAG: PIG-L family deacetylase [Chloroflexi bacterium]|nr:MAG: PIG-L family deacetylase [Chloroflexota bacterium]
MGESSSCACGHERARKRIELMTTTSKVLLPPGGQRILVVQAHPDDAEHLCGGTMALLAAEGKAIHYLFVTRGDKGSDDPVMTPERLATIREQEQRRAAATLGVQTLTFLDGYLDGEVEPTIALRREIALVVRQWKPDVVFTLDPWRKNEIHPDHRAVGMCTVDALASARGISSVVEKKIAVLCCHESQTKHRDIPAWIYQQGILAGAPHKMKYAESFHHYVM